MSGKADYVYKLVTQSAWAEAQAAGVFLGSEVDVRDGFIHFSCADQVEETLRRHFAGVPDLVVVELLVSHLGEALRWEPSRGGALFPHLYAPLPTHLARKVVALELDGTGAWQRPVLPF